MKEKLKKLFEAREIYKKVEKEIYESLDKTDVGSYDLGEVEARIIIARDWHVFYTDKDKQEIDILYKRIRKGIKPKEKIYISFYKEV